MTRPQIEALYALWRRSTAGMTYLQFRRTVRRAMYDDCIMVYWCGMWIGIEADGYTHS